jgi:hypothetical protein
MDNLPIELIQYINDQLDFVDQLNFKNTNKGFYDCIRIKQQIPYLLTLEENHQSDENDYTIYTIYPIDCFRLDEFYRMNQKYFKSKHFWEYEVYVLNPAKSIQNSPNISEFNSFDYWVSYNKDMDDYNSCNEEYGLEHKISTIGIKLNNNYDKICIDYGPWTENTEIELFNLRTFIQICINIANKKSIN